MATPQAHPTQQAAEARSDRRLVLVPASGAASVSRRADLLTAREVAALFAVDPKTVAGWERAGRLPCIRTLGGHLRLRRVDVEERLRHR